METPRDLPKIQSQNETTLNDIQQEFLRELFYNQKRYLGRDRLWAYCRDNYPEMKITRRGVMGWLNLQKPNQLTRQPPVRQKTSLIEISKPGFVGVDLKGPLTRTREGFEYILGVTDTMSRYQWAAPIRNKESSTVKDAFDKLIKEHQIKISAILTDDGSEFKSIFQTYCEEQGYKRITYVGLPWRNRQERNNKELSKMMKMDEIATGSKTQWATNLPKYVTAMNEAINRSVKVTPEQILDGELPVSINENRSKRYGKQRVSTKSAFRIGDMVRIAKRNKSFKDKITYTEDVFLITKVIHATDSKLVTYKVTDGEKELKNSYNISDLLLVNNTDDLPTILPLEEDVIIRRKDQNEVDDLNEHVEEVAEVRQTRRPKADSRGEYEVREIVAKRKFGKTLKYKVLYVGYPDSDYTWEPIRNLSNAKEALEKFKLKRSKK